MIEIIKGTEVGRYADEMDQAYRLRHTVFVEEMGWTDLAKPDRREIDQFDDEHALHMIYRRDGEVVGYQRMLPTTRPHLLSHVLPELCEVERPVGDHIWEWTRYSVRKPFRGGGRGLSPAANMLLSAIVEWGMDTGVDRMIIEMDPIWLLRLVQLHFLVEPLGIPRTVGSASVVAVAAKFDRRTLTMLRDLRGDHRSVLRSTPELEIEGAVS
ncbi:acyl-homoserine-lactone synthase [Methyloraptor flagellatus]|uniref:Acyl-homoserine-lactone synthase n=1 Tax=Methyloraptor flagellatus TaxID=3162530 RepID=A0AAU7X8B3_9HYPH